MRIIIFWLSKQESYDWENRLMIDSQFSAHAWGFSVPPLSTS